jgi:hypothetical protein
VLTRVRGDTRETTTWRPQWDLALAFVPPVLVVAVAALAVVRPGIASWCAAGFVSALALSGSV